MAIHSALRLTPERRKLSLVAIGFGLAGCILAVMLAATGSYGWFAPEAQAPQFANLSTSEAERIARRYGDQQLTLALAASRDQGRAPGGAGAAEPERVAPGGVAGGLVLVESRFLSPPPSPVAGPSTARAGGAWLFVYRAAGIPVAEWNTKNASLEIQVVISDTSGRMLQSGATLLPEARDSAATIR